MHKEALAFPPEESTLFFINSHLIITYDKQYFVTLRVKYLISNSMSESKRIKTALVSVYHKEGLDEIITKLHEEGVEFLSTGLQSVELHVLCVQENMFLKINL